MRARNILVFAASFVVAVAVLAQGSGEAKGKKAPKAGTSAPKFMPAGDLKWMDLDPTGAPGVKIADLWGDHTKGAYGAFIKFPAGFSAPLHTHTSAMKIVIVSGTFIAGPEGKPEVRLGAGSYFSQPGGNYRHTTACDKASECLFFAESTGKFDLKPVEAGKAPANK
jgi:anti-sigma factor ChrR (cupin superfamily)